MENIHAVRQLWYDVVVWHYCSGIYLLKRDYVYEPSRKNNRQYYWIMSDELTRDKLVELCLLYRCVKKVSCVYTIHGRWVMWCWCDDVGIYMSYAPYADSWMHPIAELNIFQFAAHFGLCWWVWVVFDWFLFGRARGLEVSVFSGSGYFVYRVGWWCDLIVKWYVNMCWICTCGSPCAASARNPRNSRADHRKSCWAPIWLRLARIQCRNHRTMSSLGDDNFKNNLKINSNIDSSNKWSVIPSSNFCSTFSSLTGANGFALRVAFSVCAI